MGRRAGWKNGFAHTCSKCAGGNLAVDRFEEGKRFDLNRIYYYIYGRVDRPLQNTIILKGSSSGALVVCWVYFQASSTYVFTR